MSTPNGTADRAAPVEETDDDPVRFQLRLRRVVHRHLADLAHDSDTSINVLVARLCEAAFHQYNVQHGTTRGHTERRGANHG